MNEKIGDSRLKRESVKGIQEYLWERDWGKRRIQSWKASDTYNVMNTKSLFEAKEFY